MNESYFWSKSESSGDGRDSFERIGVLIVGHSDLLVAVRGQAAELGYASILGMMLDGNQQRGNDVDGLSMSFRFAMDLQAIMAGSFAWPATKGVKYDPLLPTINEAMDDGGGKLRIIIPTIESRYNTGKENALNQRVQIPQVRLTVPISGNCFRCCKTPLALSGTLCADPTGHLSW